VIIYTDSRNGTPCRRLRQGKGSGNVLRIKKLTWAMFAQLEQAARENAEGAK